MNWPWTQTENERSAPTDDYSEKRGIWRDSGTVQPARLTDSGAIRGDRRPRSGMLRARVFQVGDA